MWRYKQILLRERDGLVEDGYVDMQRLPSGPNTYPTSRADVGAQPYERARVHLALVLLQFTIFVNISVEIHIWN